MHNDGRSAKDQGYGKVINGEGENWLDGGGETLSI